MISDVNKGITNIIYNHLNLPESICFGANCITFLYDANGNKLQKTVNGSSQDYLGGIEYKDNVVEAVYHEEGRATPSGSDWQYEYYLKDHLGNTRVIFTDNDDNGEPEIIQEADYYPFGMRHQNATATNHYLYNGKELNTDLGLDWYDYGARWLDTETGRWSTIDPMAESYASMSPFNYVANNPINSVDPDGRFILNGKNARENRVLREIIKVMRKEAMSWSPSQWASVRSITRLSKAHFMGMFISGSGPELRFSSHNYQEKLDGETGKETINFMRSKGDGEDLYDTYAVTNSGVFQSRPLIILDRKIFDIVNQFMLSKKKGRPMHSFAPGGGLMRPSNWATYLQAEEKRMHRFIIGVFGHELGHAGARIGFGTDSGHSPSDPDEAGYRMEREVLGGIINYESRSVGYGVYARYAHHQYRLLKDEEREVKTERFNLIYPHLIHR